MDVYIYLTATLREYFWGCGVALGLIFADVLDSRQSACAGVLEIENM